jgi:hypothetical protein
MSSSPSIIHFPWAGVGLADDVRLGDPVRARCPAAGSLKSVDELAANWLPGLGSNQRHFD